MTIHITRDSALQAIEESVAEQGANYLYPNAWQGCFYRTSSGEPSCLVAWAVDKLGVDVQELKEGKAAGPVLYDLESRGIVTLEQGVSQILSKAQHIQDAGRTWGQAAEEAKTIHAHWERYVHIEDRDDEESE